MPSSRRGCKYLLNDCLDLVILKMARKDLKSRDIENVLSAALYFFLDGRGTDEADPLTFTALCVRNNLSPDEVAKKIWNDLKASKKKQIRKLLARELAQSAA